jgi:hypothetical protein
MRGCSLDHLSGLPVEKPAREHDEGSGVPLRGGPKGAFDLARTSDLQREHFSIHDPGGFPDLRPFAVTIRTSQHGHADRTWNNFRDQL